MSGHQGYVGTPHRFYGSGKSSSRRCSAVLTPGASTPPDGNVYGYNACNINPPRSSCSTPLQHSQYSSDFGPGDLLPVDRACRNSVRQTFS